MAGIEVFFLCVFLLHRLGIGDLISIFPREWYESVQSELAGKQVSAWRKFRVREFIFIFTSFNCT